MINKETIVTENICNPHRVHHVCWSAIFSGAVVGLGLMILLHIYGAAISLSAYSSTPQGASVIAIGGVLGMLVGVIASMATAGFVAGYLGRFHFYHVSGGVMYGFITWSLIIVLSALVLVPMEHFLSDYESSLSRSVTLVMPNAAETKALSTDTGRVKQENVVAPGTERATNLAGKAWIIFVLFFIGALSSCVGASYGMRCRRDTVCI